MRVCMIYPRPLLASVVERLPNRIWRSALVRRVFIGPRSVFRTFYVMGSFDIYTPPSGPIDNSSMAARLNSRAVIIIVLAPCY